MSQTVNSDELIEKLEEKRVEFDKKVEEKKEEFDKKVEEKKEEIGRKVEEKRVAFWAKMSSKIGFIMLLMVFAPMMMLTIISLHRVKSTTNSTYQSYSTNLAEQAEKGVFALSQFGINVYKSYATNLASEAVTGINASITSNIQIYKSIAQNLAEQAASGVDLIEGLNTEDVQTKRADFLNSIEINGVKGSYAYLIDKDAIILNHPDDQMIGEAESIVAVSYLASKIGSDSKLTNGCVLYSDRGVQKLAGYAYTKSNEVIIIAANYDDFVKIDYTTLVGSINISGVEGSFAFLVGSDNKIIWHPDSSLIGQTLSQDDLKKIVDEASKSYQEGLCGSVIYTENKVKKVAGYAVTAEKNILFVTADYDKFVKINYDELLGSTKIGGVDSSYAYMVDSKGVILWHPDESNIGKTADNEAVKKLVTSLAEKQELSSGTITYTDKEGTKLAGYALTNDKEILIVTADSNEFMSDIISLRRSMLIFGLIVSIIFSVVGYFIAKTMVDAIERIVPIINKTANLDLQPDEKITPLLKRRDEIGVIARSVNHMSEELRRIVSEINEARENINNNVDVLYNATNQISDLCSDNSATSEELAAGMEETTASTESIANSVESIEDSAKGIEDLALNGSKLSIEVMSRAEELRATTEAASRKTTSIYESVKEKSETAMEASKSVNKINDLTKTIMSISSQTSLLALNASIEAARAGEAGRGFAVVAGEIGNLATQTSTAVTDISEIVTEVNRSVGQLAECLQEAVSFLETNVLSDYSEFGKVSVQYRDDANEFKSSMSEINSGIIELNSNIKAIVESISGINRTVNESANGVNDIAQKTSNMVNETNEASLKVEECKECVKNLNDIVDLFQM